MELVPLTVVLPIRILVVVPTLSIMVNNHMVDRWHLYGHKVSFPYNRKVGVNGHSVNYEVGKEDKFCEYLRSKEASFLWSDSEDLQAMSNL